MASRATRNLDVVVVGAGVIGLACAWRAAQRGLRVRVLERDEPGAGASGVAAGMLAPVGEATWGEERLLDLALASHAAWPGFAAELAEAAGADVGYLPLGALHVALDGDERAELRRRYELMRSLELDASWLPPSACRALEPGLAGSIAGGVHAPHEAGVDPRALLRALRIACERAGVELRTGVEADALVTERGAALGVRDAAGEVHRARTTVIAAGSWSAGEWIPAGSRPAIRPVKGQILTLRGPAGAPACERIIVTERVYLVPRGDGRLIVGATVEEQGFDLRVTAGGVHELLREAYRALPEVAELELVEANAGLRPTTPGNFPVVDRGDLDGLIFATGHFRNGILLAPVTAARVADLLTGEAPAARARMAGAAR